ncbi:MULTISPECIES: hypothetical protein [Actinomyces]|uniref:hypothetical protein n=1 Tax=Actinomyces TaxID=1654 RepID=UPI001FBB0723|nr:MULTISPECIES: hypothetical protein [Actinomyces]
MSTTTTPSTAVADDGGEEGYERGLYGPRGWSVRVGVWDVLDTCHDEMRSATVPAAFGLKPRGIIEDGEPVDDYTPFHDLGPSQARRLLEILPAAQLEDRQNLSPTLGSLLRACARSQGRIRLSGYGIGPQRPDERVTVEALWVQDPDLLDLELLETHDDGCHCREVWDLVRQRYDLDAQCVPDEIRVCRRRWTRGQTGTWLWWD